MGTLRRNQQSKGKLAKHRTFLLGVATGVSVALAFVTVVYAQFGAGWSTGLGAVMAVYLLFAVGAVATHASASSTDGG